jgi:DNA-binding response OmpR family regulator
VLDEDGLLRYDDRWVYVPDAQLPVVELFIARPGRLVDTDSIRRSYEESGGTTNPSALRKVIGRIRSRLAKVGLRLHVVRGVGAILEVPEGVTSPRP